MKYCIELQINFKLHVKWKEIDEQGTEDINYKKKIDQLEITIFELQKALVEQGKNYSYWYKL